MHGTVRLFREFWSALSTNSIDRASRALMRAAHALSVWKMTLADSKRDTASDPDTPTSYERLSRIATELVEAYELEIGEMYQEWLTRVTNNLTRNVRTR